LLARLLDRLRRTAMTVIASTSRALASAPRLGVALALLLLIACDDLPTERRGDVSFQNVAKATLPRSGPQVRTVVYDQASWQVVWRELWGNSAPPRPEIDFRREMVVVATASLSCFGDIAIESVDRDQGQVVVKIADAGPETLCLCIAPEYVFHVVRATRVDGPASFAVRTTHPRCG
jgi:hypothetical protein